MAETVFGYLTTDEHATVSTDERKWITKVMKLREKYPDEVKIICEPANNWGELVAYVPKDWIKVQPPKKMNLTEEQRTAMAEKMRGMRMLQLNGELTTG